MLKGAFGTDALLTAPALSSLGDLYLIEAKYEAAESLYQQSMKSEEDALGAEHPQVATSLRSLATLYCRKGKYAQAKKMLERSLALDQKGLWLCAIH